MNAGLTSAGESTIDSIDSMEQPVQGTETVPVSMSTTAPMTHVVTGSMDPHIAKVDSSETDASVFEVFIPFYSLHYQMLSL